MHIKDLIQKKRNLENIHVKVNNDKNILLINILNLTRKLSFYVDNALLNSKLLDGLKEKYNIKNNFIQSNKFTQLKHKIKKPRELYIYLTEEQKYGTDSYSRYENEILKRSKDSSIDFISIGERSKNFIESNKLNLLRYFDNSSYPNLTKILTKTIKILFVENNYSKVNFVINSSKNYKDPFTILPLENFDVDKLLQLKERTEWNNSLKDYKIYPNIENFIEAQIFVYLENVINSLIVESSFYNAKNNLVTIDKKIKQIDEELLIVTKRVNRAKQEKQIEEIILLTQKKKTIFDEGGN
ncbi:F0F1 ATP synthase subunit gamma [Mycoplasmopsis cynos]|uniref:ATP synthase gamma chain n=1 Tax=Mycoplasmopsis cynos (strain C142) TaxID=1246955 RepID=L0RW34_MYCC1|nr:F0F1 ATP synthase subunit gamma [Mycoplasmopsis cynos]UWV82611.1 F0F1 ATP synthase subunit gamma [Mycoplasmopsis cynos]UWV93902.1 F0F1 ATP synthase subunit gamma [Mycoplasmopsis cynos]WQQ13250.1 F0F1 ATP synthase subunit gamma [Mycoplasmopsis cynos]WQQ13859.1 F0F1 ATP synthase subunit gamma [Mycoplasmopsis cynos]WQQ14787.1 F0F1 ATP synthase subunit gamma [Mycoplasmopsis cynos]